MVCTLLVRFIFFYRLFYHLPSEGAGSFLGTKSATPKHIEYHRWYFIMLSVIQFQFPIYTFSIYFSLFCSSVWRIIILLNKITVTFWKWNFCSFFLSLVFFYCINWNGYWKRNPKWKKRMTKYFCIYDSVVMHIAFNSQKKKFAADFVFDIFNHNREKWTDWKIFVQIITTVT